MMNYCVYLHTSPTNKYYVGITKQNPLKRWANGRGYCKNKHFYKAILKYGWDNFKHEIVFSGITKDEAIQYEKYLIKTLVIRRERNIKKYNDEISRSIETAVYPDEETLKWLQFTDNMYGTNYQKAYKELAARDMTNRSKYIKYSELPDGIQGKTIGKNIDPNIGPTIGNYQIQLDPQQYVPGTGSHELSHVVDQLAGDVIKNRYLNFLADSDNIMSVPELEKKGIRIPPKIQFYLSDPQEAKAHMIQLKHAMLNSGKINNWSQKVTQQELEDFLFDPLNTQLTGSMNKLQYKMYRNKSRFLDRFNRVNPLAIGAPIGLAATNNKDKQSN